MNGIPRQDPAFTAQYEKDVAGEELLATLNRTLAPVEDESYREDLGEEYPTLHVIGVPRSGTTLLYQLVAAGLDIGYVSNLSAAFWRAPVLGLRLARKLGVDRPESSFSSTFGRTSGVSEPHEFGYFWNHHLRYPGLDALPTGHEETIDWQTLRTVLVNMAHWNDGPLAFKPMLLTWHLERMVREMPRTCYVWIRRDLRATSLSLLEMRMALFGSYDVWASLRPESSQWLAGEPAWRQVAAQSVVLDRTIESAVAAVPDGVLEIEYEELCAAPNDAVERVRALLASRGFEPRRRDVTFAPFVPSTRHALEDEYGARVAASLEEFATLRETPR